LRERKTIPVVVVTGIEVDASDLASMLGAHHVLRKPFATSELLAVVRSTVGAQ
jgi:DNA-binding response OmpR family regulator